MASLISSPAAVPAFANYSLLGRIFHWIINFLSFGWLKTWLNKKPLASDCSAHNVAAEQPQSPPVELPALQIPALSITLPQSNGLDDAPKTCPSRPAYKNRVFSGLKFPESASDDGDCKQWSAEDGSSIYDNKPKSLPVHGSGVLPWFRVGDVGGGDDVSCTNEVEMGSALAVAGSQMESLTPNTRVDFLPSILYS